MKVWHLIIVASLSAVVYLVLQDFYDKSKLHQLIITPKGQAHVS